MRVYTRTSVELDPDMKRRLKAWADRSGRPMREIIHDALKQYLETHEQQ